MTTGPSIEERVSRLEGAYEHLATKADIAELKGELQDRLSGFENRMLRWFILTIVTAITTTLAGVGTVAAIVGLLVR